MRASWEGRPLRALLLDLDDTILDDRHGSEEAREGVVRLLASRAGCPRDAAREAVAREVAWYWSDAGRHRRGRLDLAGARARIVERALEGLGRPDPALAREAGVLWTGHKERSQRLRDGALDALATLRRRVPILALVTNGAAAPQRAKIERFRLAAFFDHVQIEGEFGAGKPEPAVYEHVLGAVGAAPEESLMVGDNFEADVLGALRAGLHAAWIDLHGAGRPPRPAPRPHDTLRDLRELVDRLPGGRPPRRPGGVRASGGGGRAR